MKGTGEGKLDHRTATQAIAFVYDNLLDVSRLQIIYPLILGFVFWGKLANWKIILWCIACSSVYVARILLTLQYRKTASIDNNPWKWGRAFTTTSLFSGFLWGYAAWLFYSPDAQTELVLLYVLIVGTAAGAVMISSYWWIGYILYAVPAVTLMILSLIINGDANEKILGFMNCLLLFMLVTVSIKSRDLGYAGIRLRYENMDLVEKLNREKERAEDASRAKTQFLASANHDLRQPVHALSLLSYSLKDELQSVRGLELYSQLNQTVSNLNNLLESLLDLSQLEAGALKVIEEHIDLERVAAQIQSEFLSLCAQKNLSFRVKTLKGFVRTDQTLLLRLLRNLLTNAVRYTNEGGVLLAFRQQGGCVSIEIWDTGIGIESDDAQNVFREFFQVGNKARSSDQGLGLGLSICKKITALLDIELLMSSRVGKGSVFRILLPLLSDVRNVQTKAPVFVDSNIVHQRLAGLHVLVIDDDLTGLSALSHVLESFAMEPLLAQTEERAHELLEHRRLRNSGDAHPYQVDIIVSDFRLSQNSDGVDVIAGIRAMPGLSNLPALMVTGDTAPAVLDRIGESGLNYIHKPVQPAQLATKLSHVLGMDSAD